MRGCAVPTVPLKAFYKPDRVEVGVDEAGRGCLAGPVYAAAVVWPNPTPEFDAKLIALVRDSKRLTPSQRDRARAVVEENAVAWAVSSCTASEIDEMNILRASHVAMHRALDAIAARTSFDAILVDGDRFRAYVSDVSGDFVPHACIVDGDSLYLSIAAASILAKTHRDQHVREVMHASHPEYGWDLNKCYGTARHYEALRLHGPSPEHRRSFRLKKNNDRPSA